MEAHAKMISDARPGMPQLEVPSFDELCRRGKEGDRIEDRSLRQPEDVMLYMHSSGTTGLPKPIPITLVGTA
jgi:acyl-coenzyme A synthetase/AMP-(fatty) acid ligase